MNESVPPELENPVWHSLNGALRRFAIASADGRAMRFPPEVAPFSAVCTLDPGAWQAQAELLGPDEVAVWVRPSLPPPPPGWSESFRLPCLQMVGTAVPAPEAHELLRLGAPDSEEMQALVALTEPGPFLARTHELGLYLGVRRQGRLIAMAGQRMHPPGFREISAICVHPEARGLGLADALTRAVCHAALDRGEVPFLHVLQDNQAAISLYLKLGFRVQQKIEVVGYQPSAASAMDPKPGATPAAVHSVLRPT